MASKAQRIGIGVVVTLAVIGTIAFLGGGGGDVSGQTGAITGDQTGESTASAFSASVVSCDPGQYDNCYANKYRFEDAVAEAQINYDDLETIGSNSDTVFVKPSAGIDYKCIGDKAWVREGTDTPTVNGDGGGVSSPHNRVDRVGTIVLDNLAGSDNKLNGLQIVCADHDVNSGWWAYSYVWTEWDFTITVATDTDGDGIFDFNDECPSQGDQGFGLKDNGCPIQDSDNDGVGNNNDQCPNTSPNTPVNEDGCPKDSDNDGVTDVNDLCSGTDTTVSVDNTGCPVDTDGDGITDKTNDGLQNDVCPQTGSTGMGVIQTGEDKGCPIQDSDNDGVTDRVDQCSSTPGSGSDGCPNLIEQFIQFIGFTQFTF